MYKFNGFMLPGIIRALMQFAQYLTFFYLPLYFNELGFSGWQIGFLFSIFMLAGLFFAFPVGFSNDKFSSRMIALIGISFLIIAYLGLAVFENFYLISVSFLIFSFGVIASNQSIDTFIIRNSDDNKKGKEFSIYFVLRQTGAVFGMVLGGFLLWKTSFSFLFILNVLLYVCILFLSCYIKKEATYKFESVSYKNEVFRPDVVLLLSVILIYAFHLGAENTSYGLFLKNNLLLSTTGMGAYMGLAVFSMVITGLILSKYLDRTKAILKYLCGGLILSGSSHILMTLPDLYISFVFRVIHEIGDTFLLILMMVYVRQFFSKERIGSGNGMMSLVTALGCILGSIIFGPLGESLGYHWPLIISGGLSVIAVVPALFHGKYEKLRVHHSKKIVKF